MSLICEKRLVYNSGLKTILDITSIYHIVIRLAPEGYPNAPRHFVDLRTEASPSPLVIANSF